MFYLPKLFRLRQNRFCLAVLSNRASVVSNRHHLVFGQHTAARSVWPRQYGDFLEPVEITFLKSQDRFTKTQPNHDKQQDRVPVFFTGPDCPGCQPKQTTFSYGKDNVLLPGDGKVTPVFGNGQAKGSFSAYPSSLALDAVTGQIDIDAPGTVPGYRYLVRFVSADAKTMAHTYVTLAGIRYPSRYFDITNPDDATAKPLTTDTSAAIAGGEFAISDYAISDVVQPANFSARRQLPPTDTAAAVRQSLNAADGSVDLRQLVTGVFGPATSGKIELTINYATIQRGRKIAGQTRYTLLRQTIDSPELRTLLRNWANCDKVIEARQHELAAEKNAANIRVTPSWGLSHNSAPATQNGFFRFTRALQSFPPPGGYSAF